MKNENLNIAIVVSNLMAGYATDCCALFGRPKITYLHDFASLSQANSNHAYDIIVTDYAALQPYPELLPQLLGIASVVVVFSSVKDEASAYRISAKARNVIIVADHLSPNDTFNLIATALEGSAAAKPV